MNAAVNDPEAAPFNAAVAKVAKQLAAAGLNAKLAAPPLCRFSVITVTVPGVEFPGLRSMDKRTYSGFGKYTHELSGFTVRWDWLGHRGMGTTRYPLRKDGTIDSKRLMDDIATFVAREQRRAEESDEKTRNKRKLAADFADLKKLADMQNRVPGILINVENDGRHAGRLSFKVSGHASPARMLAIIAAVASTNELEPTK